MNELPTQTYWVLVIVSILSPSHEYILDFVDFLLGIFPFHLGDCLFEFFASVFTQDKPSSSMFPKKCLSPVIMDTAKCQILQKSSAYLTQKRQRLVEN